MVERGASGTNIASLFVNRIIRKNKKIGNSITVGSEFFVMHWLSKQVHRKHQGGNELLPTTAVMAGPSPL